MPGPTSSSQATKASTTSLISVTLTPAGFCGVEIIEILIDSDNAPTPLGPSRRR